MKTRNVWKSMLDSRLVQKISDQVIDNLVPKAVARAGGLNCYQPYTFCYGYGSGSLCYPGANDSAGTGYKYCYYPEYVVYPNQPAGCNWTCYNGCDCYKRVRNSETCPASAAGCTW